MNRELPDVQAGFQKGRGSRDQIANTCWIMKKAREFRKNMYFCFTDYAKAFDCVDHNKLWKIPKKMGVPDHLIYLLRNLYMGQEATIRTGHGTYYWFPIGKGVLWTEVRDIVQEAGIKTIPKKKKWKKAKWLSGKQKAKEKRKDIPI